MSRWILFAFVASLTAWIVQPPIPKPPTVAGLVFFCALALGLALDGSFRRAGRAAIVHVYEDDDGGR